MLTLAVCVWDKAPRAVELGSGGDSLSPARSSLLPSRQGTEAGLVRTTEDERRSEGNGRPYEQAKKAESDEGFLPCLDLKKKGNY